MIKKENILFNASAADYEEAIRLAGNILVREKAATPEYVDAMVEIARQYTYIVIAPHIAMPHARPDCGALGNSLSFVRLKQDVCFGHPEHDPVRIVIGLVAQGENDHIKVLESLAELLDKEDNMKKLLEAENQEEIESLLKKEGLM